MQYLHVPAIMPTMWQCCNDADYGDGKNKVDCSEETAGDNGNSNIDGGPNDDVAVDTNDDGGYGDDCDGDNNDGAVGEKKNSHE